ncbi:MAG TPA: hypothetical protein VMF60_08125, partial [Acidimicrobiales bacterium]|nr:hypothetical protein [Acidimicrobiales bacterium]
MSSVLPEVLAETVEHSAAPDVVGVALRRIFEGRPETAERLVTDGEPSPLAHALVAVGGASNVLMRLCLADDGALDVLAALDRPVVIDGADADALARSKRLELLRIAARDLLGRDPLEAVGAALADLAAAVLEHAGALVGADDGTGSLAMIGMGKLGGRELNYASDVDVMFVASGAEGDPVARHVLAIARRCFRVDVDLRPEGRAGPLTRTIEGFRSYWHRWAEPWEFQALMKARPVAGDAHLGRRFAEAADTTVWTRVLHADELAQLRRMKARAEAAVTGRSRAGDEIKRGPGGIRDVEFSVQLLQLVHGHHDPGIRCRSTLGALGELAEAGYVAADDAERLADAYRFLRTLEHRLQLVEEEQT